MRPDRHEHDGNELQTTPKFRSHVAKKLAAILNRNFHQKGFTKPNCANKPKNGHNEDEGFRLFRSSVPGEAGMVTSSTIPRRKLASFSSEDSEEEQQKSLEAAVSADDILRHSTINHTKRKGRRKTTEEIQLR